MEFFKKTLVLFLFPATVWSQTTTTLSAPHLVPANRVASISVSESFLNEQIKARVKSQMVQDLKVNIDADKDRVFLRGTTQVPVEELRAINLEPTLGAFKFQVAMHLSVTKQGHLVIEFPLNETYFYPADSKNPKRDRVIIPVQMLSIALASARGYLAALSGDFGGFDRRTRKLEALEKALDKSIAAEKNPDAKDDMKTEKESLRLQIAAIPLERKQLQNMAKELSSLMSFTGEKELSLNDELRAKRNALVLKIKLSQVTPYLDDIDLGGIRLRRDKKDGAGENYFVIDANADLKGAIPPPIVVASNSNRPPMKVAPSLIIRLNQALLESDAVIDSEKKEMGTNLHDFKMDLEDDGLHVSGKYKALLVSIPFDTVVDFVSTGPDVFEARVRDIEVAGIDVEFLSGFILEAVKRRLHQSLKGLCHFKYIGEEEDDARALQVTVDPKAIVPAFPDLHLINVDVRKREFLLKIGHT